MQYRKLTYEQHINLIKDFNAGMPRKLIREKYDIDHQTIYNYMSKKPSKYNTRSDQTLDHEYFSNINSEAKAYWLGFIYADGNISKSSNALSIGVSDRDASHVNKFFKDELNSSNKIYKYGSCSFFNVSSKSIKQNLISLGVSPAKTFKIKPPKEISKKYIRHFIRGYFDGDGCITHIWNTHKTIKRPKIDITGTKSLLLWLLDQFKACIKLTPVTTNNNIFSIRISKQEDVKRIYHYLYDNASIYLPRKKQKFDELLGLSKTQIS